MSTIASPITVLTITLLAVLHGTPVAAQPSKVWVSNGGIDFAGCGAVTAPCKTFQRAHDNVAPGGEIGVLTPGDYGNSSGAAVVITKAVGITNDGAGEASILVLPFGTGMIIAPTERDIVSLRGLVFDGMIGGSNAILVSLAAAVHMQNCVVRNFETSTAIGILVHTANLFVSDTIVFNNGSTQDSGGIVIQPQTTQFGPNVVLNRVVLENNVRGLWVDGSMSTGNGPHVVIRDSLVSGNAGDGIIATSAPGKAPAFIVVERTTSVSNAGAGILANGPHATMLLDGTLVARNGVGISAVNGGQLISYGNNKVNNNLGVDGIPTGSYSPI